MRRDPEKFRQGGPSRITQMSVRTSLEKRLDQSGPIASRWGQYQYNFRETYSHLWFSRGGLGHLPPSGSAHAIGKQWKPGRVRTFVHSYTIRICTHDQKVASSNTTVCWDPLQAINPNVSPRLQTCWLGRQASTQTKHSIPNAWRWKLKLWVDSGCGWSGMRAHK